MLRCVKVLLERNKYHLHTSQKRFLVKLLESYPIPDFRGNLILSRMGAQRNIRLIEFLDYSVYSRSAAHMEAVNALRDGALHSRMSIAQRKLAAHDPDALDYLAQRPDIMLRMTAQLLRNGYSKDEITERLFEKADMLSMQTIITGINKFSRISPEEKPETEDLIGIFESLIPAKLKTTETPLRSKKVKLSMDGYALDFSEICCNDKSAEGGYIRSGIAYKIPDEISRVRFFVYWNDMDRVDVDLHASITNTEGEYFRIGWNENFRNSGAVFSGDITQSNAAEYIDIDMSADIKRVFANIHLFSGKNSFGDIETCYVGMMAVPETKQTVRKPSQKKLYSEKNCFFKHNLRQNCRTMNYGYVDVQDRYIVFDGKPGDSDSDWYAETEHSQRILSISRYLEYLFDAQGVTLTEDADEADIILVMGKPSGEKEMSLIDENFFMDSENEQ